MHKSLILLAAGGIMLAPQLAFAQGSNQSTNPNATQNTNNQTMNIQARVKANLEQAGFTNVQIMPSSFLVRAKDKDGNPVMMVINPDSVTAITEVGGNPSTTGNQANASTGTNQRLNLTQAQRQEIWQDLSKQATKQNPPSGFTPRVGERVPNSINLSPVPASVGNQVPAVRSYEYAMLQSQILLVDPSSKQIAEVISE